MDEVCAELDTVFITYFELFEQLQGVRRSLAEHCDQVSYCSSFLVEL
jgi:hypothetical protein